MTDNSNCQFTESTCTAPAVKTLRGVPLCQQHYDYSTGVFRDAAKNDPTVAALCRAMGIPLEETTNG